VDHADAVEAEEHGPALIFGGQLGGQAEILEQQRHRPRGSRRWWRRREDRGENELERALEVLRATLPVKPSVTTTSTGAGTRSRPSTLPTKLSPSSATRSWCVSLTSGVPLVDSHRSTAVRRADDRRYSAR